MTFDVSLKKSAEGYALWCPALRGCWSQGSTRKEALENIKDAIEEYLAAAKILARKSGKVAKVRVAA
jgi:predicted RNase H-like HicB family nuclease